MQQVQPIPDLRVALLDAEGEARAIGIGMAVADAERLTIDNRDPARGQTLMRRTPEKTGVPTDFLRWEARYHLAEGTDPVVNATSIGLLSDREARVPIDPATLESGRIVIDLIPNPPRTWLIREAETRECLALYGPRKFVNQGVIGIRLRSKLDPNPDVMQQALESIFTP